MSNSMSSSRNNALKSKVVIGFVFVLGALGGASYISYQSFNELTNAVNTISASDSTLEQIDHVMVTITQAENALQEYTISKSPEKLDIYSKGVEQISHNASLLKHRSNGTEKNIDSVLSLIEKKLVNLESFVNISKQRDKFDFYNKALKELEQGRKQASAQDSTHFLENVQKQRSVVAIARDLFGTAQSTPSVQEVAKLPADSVKKILRQVRNQQAAQQRRLDNKELQYLENNAQVMGRIHELLNQLKQKQQARYQARSERAKASIEDALVRIGFILLIALFSAMIIVYLILADITRSEFYKRRLLAAKSKAEKLARVKEDFLANMSHEIRTPLTAILGFTEQLRYTSLDFRQEEYLQSLDASSQHLLALVNDVLDFSKIEAGGLTLECVPFHLLEAIEEVQYALQPQAEKKGLIIRTEANEEAIDYVEGDSFRLKQILYNLISNAIKFTHEGEVVIALQIAPHAAGEVKAIIEVRDTGIGIASNQLDSVFRVFSQSDASTTRKYGGTGLGLSICKKLVEIQGGTIGVSSVLNEGSTFRVALPYLLSHVPEEEVEKEIVGGTHDTIYRGQALVIDDQPLNNKLLELSLKNKGIRTISATSGRIGLALLQQKSFDIVFCDLHMPEMDGKQVIQAMMKNALVVSRKIPIIAFTANVLPQERKQYEGLGVSDFLLKPFTHKDLDSLLALHLPAVLSFAEDNEVADEMAADALSGNSNEQYSLEGVKQFTGEDEGLLVDYLENFVNTYSASIDQLQEALDQQNVSGISFYAHKMVSHAELLKHLPLTRVLKELERLSEEGGEVNDKVTSDVAQAIQYTERLINSMQREIGVVGQKVIS